jgi:hypothetical protein
MEIFEILIFIIIVICCITYYKRYSPNIDIIISKRKFVVLLWYNKKCLNGKCKRAYIKLFTI